MQFVFYCIFPNLRGILPFIVQPLLFLSQLKYLMYNKDSSSESGGNGYLDPRFKRVLWYLIGSTKGGVNRAKILEHLNTRPANANRLATELKLDYKTVLHHLKVLSENGLIITDNKDSYGATYFLTPLMEKNYSSLKSILAKINDISGSV
jgi:DNA-binding transcriptional ArsR family regulator